MELLDKIYIGKLIDVYGKILSPKQLDAVSGYFLQDLSLTEIAENEGVTRQAAYDNVNKGKQTLLSIEEKVGKLKQSEQIKNIIAETLNHTCDKKVCDNLNKILDLLG